MSMLSGCNDSSYSLPLPRVTLAIIHLRSDKDWRVGGIFFLLLCYTICLILCLILCSVEAQGGYSPADIVLIFE
jgi:hypothetical protein